LSVKIMFGGKS